MSQEIGGVQAKLNEFASQISGSGIDYHVIMLAAQIPSNPGFGICIPEPLGGPGCTDGPRYKQIDQQINSINSLSMIQQHITEIESFLRPHSLRHIVIVSDDESRAMSANQFDSFITSRSGFDDYRLHGIVGLFSDSCLSQVGSIYKDLAQRTGGLLFHICNADWTALVTELSQDLADVARLHYTLAHAPINGVVVHYGNTEAQAGVDYDFDPIGQQIVLKGSLPAPGTSITACYTYAP